MYADNIFNNVVIMCLIICKCFFIDYLSILLATCVCTQVNWLKEEKSFSQNVKSTLSLGLL